MLAHDHGRQGHSQRERRQEHRLQAGPQTLRDRHVAGRGQDLQPDGEHIDEHDAQPEIWNRHPTHRQHGARLVGIRVWANGGENAYGHRDQQRDRHGHHRELKRHRKAGDQSFQRGLSRPDGSSKVSLQHPARHFAYCTIGCPSSSLRRFRTSPGRACCLADVRERGNRGQRARRREGHHRDQEEQRHELTSRRKRYSPRFPPAAAMPRPPPRPEGDSNAPIVC